MIRNSILALLLVQCCLVASRALSDELYEPVCPIDYSLIQLKDGSEEIEESQRRRWLQQETESIPPPIKVIRQSEDSVEFTVQNTTSFEGVGEGFVPEHIFVFYATDVFGSEHCLMHTELGPVNGGDSSTDIRTAHCFDSKVGRIALVHVYARSLKSSTSTDPQGSAAIPRCCQDPYADTASEYNTFSYVYEIRCSVSCDDPNNYYIDATGSPSNFPTQLPTDVVNKAPPTTSSPTTSPTDSSTVSPTATPTASPTATPTASPTATPTAAPTLTPSPPGQQCNAAAAASPLSRDLIMGKQMNGPHWGSRHGWAWPQANNNGCDRYASVDNDGTGAYAWPCFVSNQMVNNRVLGFDSSYMKFRFKFDEGMKAEISLAGDYDAAESVKVYPSGVSASNACSTPPENAWHDYPIRLVKSGRYHHHWYAERVNCNGEADDTRIEIKVTPDW